MSIADKIQTIANNLTNVYGAAYIRGRDTGHTVGYRKGYSTGFDDGNVNGYTAGKAHGKQECQAVHYAGSFLGSGGRKMVVELPFKPDVLQVFSSHSYSGQISNSLKGVSMDLRACGLYVGDTIFCQTADTVATAVLSPEFSEKFVKYEDGVMTLELPENMMPSMIWPSNVRYTVVAAKYPEESVADLLREQITLLPEQVPQGNKGVLSYYGAYVFRYLSLEEWETLILQKPNWTFVMK